MYLGIQPNLVERAVFEAVRQDGTLRPLYERQFADCYKHPEGPKREQAFAQLHEKWFNDLGLRDLIVQLVNEFSFFRDRVDRLMVAKAPGPKAQTAELFGSEGQYTVVIAVAPATLLDRPAFQYWARHEFMHIDDMLNPAFQYDSSQRPVGSNIAASNLLQDRFAVLWALSVDARLARRELAPTQMRERRKTEFMRAFASAQSECETEAFDRLWENEQIDATNHRQLLKWAQEGPPGLAEAGRSIEGSSAQPSAGSPCPLCGFPTFDWADAAQGQQAREAVRRDFPDWTSTQGLCGRCAEVYRSCNCPDRTVQV